MYSRRLDIGSLLQVASEAAVSPGPAGAPSVGTTKDL
jgi:hypothetical protein